MLWSVNRRAGARRWWLAAGGLGIVLPLQAAIWPDMLAGCKKTAGEPISATTDRALWEEYGLDTAEQADYVTAAGVRFQALAWRLKDPTSALAVFQWKRPAEAQPSRLATVAAQTRDGVLLEHGNYVLQFTNWRPKPEWLQPLLAKLPKLDLSALPTLRNHLPPDRLIPNSQRYVLGPVALERFDPGIPAATAAFELGAEAQLGSYQGRSGTLELAVFSYPTMQIARLQQVQFQKLPNAVAKRAGPLVAVILAPPDREEAERLLSAVRFNATITWSERVPTARDNVPEMILNIFVLIGILLGLFIIAGLAFGFLRRWLGWGSPDEPMILLHLQDR